MTRKAASCGSGWIKSNAMRNPESEYLDSLTIDQAEQRAIRTLRNEMIDPEEFRDLYGDKAVEEDKRYTEEMEQKFKDGATPETRERIKLATILEAIVHENAELSDWFGPDAHTIKSSRFDDIKHGVDTIVELRETGTSASHLALAVDATLSIDLAKKFERIKGEIERGELTKVKYFASEHLGVRGELSRLPRVVIGTDAKTIKELADLWLERNQRALGTHPVQFQILEEILDQLDAFEQYAVHVRQPEIALIYEKAKKLILAIDGAKRNTIEAPGERDEVFYAIQNYAQNFRSGNVT